MHPSALPIYCKTACCCCCCCSVICWLRINITFKTKSTTKLMGCDVDDVWDIVVWFKDFLFVHEWKENRQTGDHIHPVCWCVLCPGSYVWRSVSVDVLTCVWLQCDLCLLQELSMCLWKQRWLPYTDIWGEDSTLAVLNHSKNSLPDTHCVHTNTVRDT